MIEQDRQLGTWLIRQGISCPLRMLYLMERQPFDDVIPYQHHLKIVMRRALGLTCPGGMEASSDPAVASAQTREWLQAPDAVIYGGILVWQSFRARIPLMVRRGSQLEICQLHGKLWKSSTRTIDRGDLESGRFVSVIREAAYKRWLLERAWPDLTPKITLCFPNAQFRTAHPDLYEGVASGEAGSEDVEGLFVRVDPEEAVDALLQGVGEPSPDRHTWFDGYGFDDQLQMLGSVASMEREPPFEVTRACKTCRFRSEVAVSGEESCWQHHLEGEWRYPDRHVYELVGVGNDQEVEQRNHLQEEVPLQRDLESFQQIKEASRDTITIQQRRALQLLSSRGQSLPSQWVKRHLLQTINHLRWPLHFLDFESATSPVPLRSGTGPYQPVIFQYSCHTLYEDGRLEHHHWLDRGWRGGVYRTEQGSVGRGGSDGRNGDGSGGASAGSRDSRGRISDDHDPAGRRDDDAGHVGDGRGVTHMRLVESLLAVPDITHGTILHYSPFEKQALKRLWREFSAVEEDGDSCSSQADQLRSLIAGSAGSPEKRFRDMGIWIRDYYYNREMSSGLGLKEVLYSILKTSPVLQRLYQKPLSVDGEEVALVQWEQGILSDPYQLIGGKNPLVLDGASAMYAWLHTKSATCSDRERIRIQKALTRYCFLDTLALVMICQHVISLSGRASGEEDLVIR